MKLEKKKELAAKTLGVGKGRIIFNVERLSDIKEAITKQDMRDLFADGAIAIREIKGSAKKEKRKTRRRAGSIKMKPKHGKQPYVILTRKLRNYLSELRKQEKLTQEKWLDFRKKIRARVFKSKAHLREKLLQ